MERIRDKTQRGRGAEISCTEGRKTAAFELGKRRRREEEEEETDGIWGGAEEDRGGQFGRTV